MADSVRKVSLQGEGPKPSAKKEGGGREKKKAPASCPWKGLLLQGKGEEVFLHKTQSVRIRSIFLWGKGAEILSYRRGGARSQHKSKRGEKKKKADSFHSEKQPKIRGKKSVQTESLPLPKEGSGGPKSEKGKPP